MFLLLYVLKSVTCSDSEQADSVQYNEKHRALATIHQQRITEVDDQPMKPRWKDTLFQYQSPFFQGRALQDA